MAEASDEKQKAEGQTDAKAADRAARRKRGRKNIAEGVVHIHSTFNNTIVTITDRQGNTRNVAFGRVSTISPCIWMVSSLAISESGTWRP